jgi:hypothetical protein
MASGSAMFAAGGGTDDRWANGACKRRSRPAAAAIAVFAALALAEALAPLHRGIAEIGRMRDAAARLAPTLEARQDPNGQVSCAMSELSNQASGYDGVTVAAPGSVAALIQPIDLACCTQRNDSPDRGSRAVENRRCSTPSAGLSLPLSGTITAGRQRPLMTCPRAALRAQLGIPSAGQPSSIRHHPMELDVVELSRLQFAMTAMYHFLFVPLTLGLSIIVAIMETVYVMTGRPIWRQMTKFWGTLFGINFVLGVATGITMEFQFGMNWSYYSHYVGDIFGAPLAIEGLMAFFLEATFVGLFFFGWDKLSKVQHLVVAWLVAHRLELLGAVDPDRQRLDAEPGRRGVQPETRCAWR